MNIREFDTIGYFIKHYFNWSMDYSELEGLIEDFLVRENEKYVEAFRQEIETMYTLNDPELFRQVAYRLGDRGMPTDKAKSTMELLYVKTRKEKREALQFTAQKYIEDDGTVTLSLNEMDIIENGENEKTARLNLARAILEYAADYYNEYDVYSHSPSRKGHIPYIFKALAINSSEKLGDMIKCQDEMK